MYSNKSFAAIIPARSGSVSVKNKNLQKISGKSLFQITLDLAKKSKFIDDIIVTSNDHKILAYESKRQYQKIIFLKRSNKLSSNKSSMLSVIKDVEERIKKKYDYFLILQVTCPFRKLLDINNSIKKIIKENSDNVISVTLMDDFHPARMYQMKSKKLISLDKKNNSKNRQMLPKIFHRNGMIYLFKTSNIKKYKNFYGKKISPYIIEKERSINIDNYQDLIYARAISKKKITSFRKN